MSDQIVYTRREIILTMTGLLLIMFLGTLDQTITATALPRIVGELQHFDLAPWVTTIYLVIATVTVPIYGKLSDQFGRKPILLVGLGIFLGGSMLSGLAQTMMQLIVFRAVQALGDGALVPIASAVVGDLFPPRERAKWMGITTSAYGLATIVGPILGGWLTENISWRLIFYVNVPVGLLVLALLLFIMPTLRRAKRLVRIDYTGALLLVLGVVPLMLGFSWAGGQYAWLSLQVLGLFVVSAIFILVFLWYEAILEKRQQEPILEPGLFRKSTRIYGVSMAMSLLLGMVTYGGAFYVPFFLQGVVGVSVTNSGLLLIPFALASIVGAATSGTLMSILGRYKWQSVVGVVIALLGFLLLLQLNIHSASGQVTLGMIVMGLGLGSGLAIYTTATQNALPDKKGQVTAATTFFRQIGGSIGLACMGAVMNASYLPAFQKALSPSLQRTLPSQILAIFENPSNLSNQGRLMIGKLDRQALGQLQKAMKMALTQGIHNVFLFCFALLILALVVVLCMKELPLRSRQQKSEPPASEVPSEEAVSSQLI